MPTLSVDMAEYRTMQKLMGKVQDEARAIKRLMHVELPKLERRLAETTGLFKGKSARPCRKRLKVYNRRSTAGWTGCPVF